MNGFIVRVLGVAAILAAVAFVYSPAVRGGWIWDDTAEVPGNDAVRGRGGLAAIWLAPVGPDYLPLKTVIQRLEWRLWGARPVGYHVVNAALHAGASLLLWVLLVRLGVGSGSGAGSAWLGAMLFAVHPLAVESVAWIAELKNALSLPPLLLSMIAWVDYDRSGRRRDYAVALAWFAAAMLCKTSVVMFPVVMLLYAWWRRGRLGRTDLARSAPFFGISLLLGAVTLVFQLHRAIGAEASAPDGLLSKVAGAGLAAAFYLWKSLFPTGLMPIYPRWRLDPPSAAQFLPWLAMMALAIWLWTRRRAWSRAVLLGLGFFMINLVPVLGFLPMYYLRISRVADHFAYVPLVGCVGLAAAGVGALRSTLAPGIVRAAAAAAAAIALASLAIEARGRAAQFADPETFWNAAVHGNPEAWTARNNLGAVLAASGRLEEGIAEYEEALRLEPDDAEAHFNLALALGREGRWEEAAGQDREALRLRPSFAEADNSLGEALFRQKRIHESIGPFESAARLKPDYAEAWDNLGAALAFDGRLREAIDAFERALRARPDFPEAHSNLATALAAVGRGQEAQIHYDEAARLRAQPKSKPNQEE